ncbi:ribonuclease HII [Actinomadura madurae]|uniref:ribonuclease HII n=1 Tax=Actinomadura madurae TaxID=1993 RepID=UPI0020D1FA41|nr:ribonuclease HII [Actinomadura madurae]
MRDRPLRFTPRRDAGLFAYERALAHAGFSPVAGVDEAGRGACAGPMVVGAVILQGGRGRIDGLTDSKLLTPARREALYTEITERAHAWSAVIIPCHDIDRIGLHRCNITGMRRALAALDRRPAYVLSDGFPVPGLDVPGLAMIKGTRSWPAWPRRPSSPRSPETASWWNSTSATPSTASTSTRAT